MEYFLIFVWMKSKKITEKIIEKQVGIAFLLFLSFVEGFLVMAVEILSSCLISPQFGHSLSVMTFVLGITMLSLALGYFLGSHLSKKENSIRQITVLFIFISISIFSLPYIATNMFRGYYDTGLLLTLFVSVSCFLFLPLLFLGSLTSLIIKQISRQTNLIGFSSAKVYALSSFGGVLSALLVAFVLLPNLSVFNSLFLASCLGFLTLILLAYKMSSINFKRIAFILPVFFIVIYTFTSFKQFSEPLPKRYKEIYYSDGVLGQVRIIDNYRTNTRSLYTNNTVQTLSLLSGESLWEYVAKISMIINEKKNSSILLAGLGGGIIVKQIQSEAKHIDVVDLDKRMVEISSKFYKIKRSKKINFFVDDIRHFIRKNEKKYDQIILDLSASETVPSHVYTQEAFQELQEKLNPEGKLLIHYFSDYSKKGLKSIDALMNTMNKAGFNVQLVQTEKKKDELSSIVFIAKSKKSSPISVQSPTIKLLSKKFSKAVLMTDDKPILDIIRNDMALETRKKQLENYQLIWKTIRSLEEYK